ncbi:hypothetical protein [Litchfieldia alkalitelluris]|nr:hypothetical protein [Litchfieldia alkalitelluris]
MPYYSFKEVWTPLTLVRVRFFKCMNDGTVFVKVGNRPRKQIFAK